MTSHRWLLAALTVVGLTLCFSPQNVAANWPYGGVQVALDGSAPESCSDGAGGVIAVWEEENTELLRVQHVLADGTVDPTWPAAGVELATDTESPGNLYIVADGLGGAFVAFTDFEATFQWDVHIQHILASGIVDPTWPTEGIQLSAESGQQRTTGMIADGSGGVLVTWFDLRFKFSAIFVQRVTSSGVDPSWPSGGQLLVSSDATTSLGDICTDGAGGAFIAFSSTEIDVVDVNVYAHHLLSTGEWDPLWPEFGQVLSSASGRQDRPRIVPDGTGGAIVAWLDDRDVSLEHDVYAARVSSAGVSDPSWPADGLAVCTVSDFSGLNDWGEMVSDGAGGAFVVSRDDRFDDGDVFAHHILPSGVTDPSWPNEGLAVCTAAGPQHEPVLASDGDGGFVAVWRDRRTNGLSKTYAQRVRDDGTIYWEADGRLLGWPTGIQFGHSAFVDDDGNVFGGWLDNREGVTGTYVQKILPEDPSTVPESEYVNSFDVRVFPIPATDNVRVQLAVRAADRLSVSVVDASGRTIRELWRDTLSEGQHVVVWDGQDGRGMPAASGVYFVRIETASGEQSSTRVVLTR